MSSSFVFGCLLAFYFYVGRWTFARLDGDFFAVPVIEQPRFWLVAALVGVAVMMQTSVSRHARRFRLLSVDASMLAYLCYMMLTTIWGSSAGLAADKAFELALMSTVALVMAASRSCWLDDKIQLGFWSSIVIIGLALGTLAILNGSDLRAYAPGGGPNTFGRNMGLMAFGALYLASRYGLLARAAAIGLVALAAMLVVRCGSRGGLLASGGAAIIYTVSATTTLGKKILITGIMGAATAIGLFYTDAGQQAVEVFHGRVIEQTVENRYLAGRDDLWLTAIEMAQERLIFGSGLHEFELYNLTYPHNIFLETAVGGGLVGVALLMVMLWTSFAGILRNPRRLSRLQFAAVMLVLLASQTSGDLFDSRGIFLLCSLFCPAQVAAGRARRMLTSMPHSGRGKARYHALHAPRWGPR